MKKYFNIILIALITFTIFTQVSIAQENSELKKISLIYSDHSPPNTGGMIFFREKYLPRVQKELARIGYEFEITFHHNESLFKSTEQVQACEAGIVDITIFAIDYEVERAPLHEILAMPLMGYNEYTATRIWFELQETIPEFKAEMRNKKELFHFMALPLVFNMNNKEARVPEDFKGLKMQSAGNMADLLRSIGAVPVTQVASDWYTSLKKKLIDGVAMGIAGVPLFGLQDVLKVHIMPTGDSLGLNGIAIIMNLKKFESFPPEVRKIIDDNVLWASNQMVKIEADNIPRYMEICKKAGNSFIKLTPEEMIKWYDAIAPLHKEWIKQMESRGLPGEKVYNEANRLAKKYKNQK